MTAPDETTAPPDQTEPISRPRYWPRFELSGTQLIATALAAITATIAGSYLGVSGTVIGAAVVSVVSAIGNAVYGHSLRTTRDRVREVVPAGRFSPRPVPPAAVDDRLPELPSQPRRLRKRAPWRRIAVGAVTVFAAVLAAVTGVEIVAGRPLSDLLRGDSGSGTTVFGDGGHPQRGGSGGTSSGTPTVTTTVTPSVVVTTPTVTETAAPVTKTATPTTTTSTSPPSAPDSAASTPTGTDASSGATSPLG